jgi:hypothetical protein
MEVCMRENGLKTNNMDMEQNHGISIKSNTLVTFKMARNLAQVALSLKVDITREIS